MTRAMATLACCALLAVGVGGGPGAPNQQLTFRGRVDAVSVNVAVTRGRNPVAGLTAEDFELRDNGVPQTIDSVERETVPIDVTVVVSGALAQPGVEEDVVRGALEAGRLTALLRPADRLRWLHVRMDGVREIRSPDQLVARGVNLVQGLPVVDSVFYVLSFPVDPGRRHLVVVFTDGFDHWSIIEPQRLPALADHSDAVLHAVLYAMPPSGSRPGGFSARWESDGSVRILEASLPEPALRQWRESFELLTDAVRRTGGMLHQVSRGVDPLEGVIEDFRSSYLLTYRPTGVDLPGWHDIDVTVTRPGRFDARARRGYQGR